MISTVEYEKYQNFSTRYTMVELMTTTRLIEKIACKIMISIAYYLVPLNMRRGSLPLLELSYKVHYYTLDRHHSSPRPCPQHQHHGQVSHHDKPDGKNKRIYCFLRGICETKTILIVSSVGQHGTIIKKSHRFGSSIHLSVHPPHEQNKYLSCVFRPSIS